MLELRNVYWATPDGEQILKGVDLTVPDNKLVVITGPNGGGKTTIAKLIAGIECPQSGSLFFNGADITRKDVTERARMGISYAFQQPVRFKGLTVRDLLELAAGEKLSEEGLCNYLSNVGLCAREYMDREVNGALSGGEIKRIEIASVLARGTSLSVFDEPEAGIDLWSFTSLISAFENLRREHSRTLVIISHQERIMEIADEIIVISDGKVKESGAREQILPKLLSGGKGCVKCPGSMD